MSFFSHKRTQGQRMTDLPPSIHFVSKFVKVGRVVLDTLKGQSLQSLLSSKDGSIIPRGASVLFVAECQEYVVAGHTSKFSIALHSAGHYVKDDAAFIVSSGDPGKVIRPVATHPNDVCGDESSFNWGGGACLSFQSNSYVRTYGGASYETSNCPFLNDQYYSDRQTQRIRVYLTGRTSSHR